MTTPIEIFSQKPTWFASAEAAQYERELEELDIDRLRKRAKKAIAKSLKVVPVVRRLIWLDQPPLRRRYYSVRGRHENANEYSVNLFTDRDGSWFGDCTCYAGSPPVNEFTGVITWHPNPCYHLAAVLLQYARDYTKKGKENDEKEPARVRRGMLGLPERARVAKRVRTVRVTRRAVKNKPTLKAVRSPAKSTKTSVARNRRLRRSRSS